jgi:hypothetical protein
MAQAFIDLIQIPQIVALPRFAATRSGGLLLNKEPNAYADFFN